jgi:hypothetical protein
MSTNLRCRSGWFISLYKKAFLLKLRAINPRASRVNQAHSISKYEGLKAPTPWSGQYFLSEVDHVNNVVNACVWDVQYTVSVKDVIINDIRIRARALRVNRNACAIPECVVTEGANWGADVLH